MSYIVEEQKKMEDLVSDVTVVDVYDMASEIGKEFERIIEHFGPDSVAKVLPKVIGALEHLESLALKNERENTTIQELTNRITKLEMDKIEKAEDRQRFEAELEQIEDHWRQESKELVTMVTRLQEENRKLKAAASSEPPPPAQELDMAVLHRLRNMVDKQRDQIRAKDKELAVKISELETLTGQVEKLTSSAKELRRKHKTTLNQVRTLIDERADFLAQLQDQQCEITTLQQSLGQAHRENEDLSLTCTDIPDLRNKAIYDLDDPCRPRFTTSELKDLLQERNELKARVSDLEEEINKLRPTDDTYEIPSPPSWNIVDVGEPPPNRSLASFPLAVMDAFLRFQPYLPLVQTTNPAESGEEDLPVQGPMPYEPDDAPWKKCESESGIRKFFRKLFSETNISLAGPSPRRSFSTLSKMALSAGTSDTSV